MPSRRSGGTTRRKHSLGNLRRAHPASGATWNVQVVRGKMSSKCLWHACRALVLGLTLMLLGAGMATLGYYADHLSTGLELRGNVTVRVKNDFKGFHLNNFSYVGPIVMGFGGFIVVASCVMTFEARDSAAKVVPARLRATTTSKITTRSNQGSAASQRRAIGMQLQSSRWDQHFGVFRSSPAEPPVATSAPPMPFDRDALTAELIKFSKSLSNARRVKPARGTTTARHTNSSSLIQRTTRESASNASCTLLQPPTSAGRIYWQASSFDESARKLSSCSEKRAERTRRSDTAKRHVLARQKPIEHEEDRCSPLGHRRNSTMSDSSYSGRWTVRCASIASHASSIDSRRIQVDLHSPEVMPKSILRSPKRYNSGPSATPSVEKEFRSQLSVCSEPPATIRQLSGQSSLEPCVPEETYDMIDERMASPTTSRTHLGASMLPNDVDDANDDDKNAQKLPSKKQRPDTLPITPITPTTTPHGTTTTSNTTVAAESNKVPPLYRSHSSRSFYRPKPAMPKDCDDSICYMRSNTQEELYDSLQVINERRTTLLKADSLSSLGTAERKLSSYSLKMPEITERENSIDVEDALTVTASSSGKEDTVLQMEPEPQQAQEPPKQELATETAQAASEEQAV